MSVNFKELGVEFDENGNTTISKERLLLLIQQSKRLNGFYENECRPLECFCLLDRDGKDFYAISIPDMIEWEDDGSFEKGDKLYKMELIKQF